MDNLSRAIRNMEDPFAEEPAVKYEYSNLSNKNIDLSALGIPKSVSEQWLANQAASIVIEFVPIVGNIKVGFDMKYGHNIITEDKYDDLDYKLGTVSIILGSEVKIVSKVITKASEIKGMSKVLEHEGVVVKGTA